MQEKYYYLVLKKRRYRCSCAKRFLETYSFLPRYFQRTAQLTAFIASKLHDTTNLSSVADRANVSPYTVGRILDSISFERPTLGEAISIDEFKVNTNSEKYQCIIVDPIKHRVLDIIPDRKQATLAHYFYSIPKKERYRVKYFCCDMRQQYVYLAKTYFPNAQIITDKYHFIRQTSWAIENIRKHLQKNNAC